MLKLNEFIDPWIAVEQNTVVSGIFDLSRLPRLLDLVANPVGTAQCKLEFFQDLNHHHCVKGRIWGKIYVVCQRCLGSMEMLLEIETLLALVTKYEEIDSLSDNYEPLMITDNKISPLDIVEDEILLALPDFPVHEKSADCLANNRFIITALQKEPMDNCGYLKNPFQCLEQIKESKLTSQEK